jgi:hypothetical protein
MPQKVNDLTNTRKHTERGTERYVSVRDVRIILVPLRRQEKLMLSSLAIDLEGGFA